MNTFWLVIYLVVGVALAIMMLPIIGTGLLVLFGIVAVLLIVSIISNLISGRNGGRIEFHTFTFNRSPSQEAESAKEREEETFAEQYGEDSGEVVELPSGALHKEEEQ